MMRLLVAIDLSDQTAAVVEVTRQTARATNGAVVLLHVAEPDPAFIGYEAGPEVVREQVAHEYREEHRQLQEHADALRAEGVDTTTLLIQGATGETIIAEAERLDAAMIIMGTHGRSAMFDLAIGSVSHAVIRRTKIPVLLVPLRER